MCRSCSIGLLFVLLVLSGCGGASEASNGRGNPSAEVRKVVGTPAPPPVQVPPGPPPTTKVIINELRKGHGVQLKEGDWFTLNYVAVNYRTGRTREAHWEKSGGFTWQYGKGKTVKGWVPGLRGMRVGGRRELIVPSNLAYHSGALVYVVELLEVN